MQKSNGSRLYSYDRAAAGLDPEGGSKGHRQRDQVGSVTTVWKWQIVIRQSRIQS